MYRFTGRTQVRLDVEVWHQDISLGTFRTRDIDVRAVFIEVPQPVLRRYDSVTAEFLIDGKAGRRYPVQGRVIRCVDDGVAVLFQSQVTDLLRALDQEVISLGQVRGLKKVSG